ncbi:MAG: FliM/FliN family flagellar motor switch protein, partial [Nitrospirota bacterium]|nr:FliM/FliN family flagellar motor switch protein [Nitrospirota bacterium]
AVVTPTEVVVTTLFKIEIDGEGGDIFIGMPYPTIEPIREKLYGSFQSDQDEENKVWAKRFAEQMTECNLSAVAEIGKAELTVGELTKLSVGDVIMLNRTVKEDLDLKIEGKTVFHGRAGLHRGNVAFQITSISKDRKK